MSKMREVAVLLLVFISAALLSCATPKDSNHVVSLQLSMNWTSKSGCSFVSPPMHVEGIPSEAKYLNFEMTDLDKPDYHHGGGTIVVTSSSMDVKEGSLDKFQGPCPPQGFHRYRMKVEALDSDKSLVLARGYRTLAYP